MAEVMECLRCLFELPCGEHRFVREEAPMSDAEYARVAGMVSVCEAMPGSGAKSNHNSFSEK